MSDEIAIRIKNLGKKYRLNTAKGAGTKYWTLQESLLRLPKRLWKSVFCQENSEEFWAIKDISFEVKRGEVLGIIGRNGAGKSTLLKILSRITEPTCGRAEVFGRIGALLEVGTGFHPELTGRENIYLSGAILGLKRWEIRKKFDDIVQFSEIEKFIDNPAKQYSSGMYMRLAFAVAAHLDPEILIVDEVLAVGDAQFQKKCLGKLGEAADSGRTVLFVSHNIGLINSLCKRVVHINDGNIINDGPADKVITKYYSGSLTDNAEIHFSPLNQDSNANIISAFVKNKEGFPGISFVKSEPIVLGMKYKVKVDIKVKKIKPYPNCSITNGDGVVVFYTSPKSSALCPGDKGMYKAEFIIPANLLNSGPYFASFAFASCDNGVETFFLKKDCLTFTVVEEIDKTLEEFRNGFAGPLPGVVNPDLKWTMSKINLEDKNYG